MNEVKRVYFVRHGSTDLLEAQAYQRPDTPLNWRGKAQAKLVAQRFLPLTVDIIVTSTMVRAVQTAEHIAAVKHCEIVRSNYFHEVMRPSIVWGKLHRDPAAREIMQQVHEHFGNDDMPKHSDEEKFTESRTRASRALLYLEKIPAKNVVVVSHGRILRTMFAVMMLGRDLAYSDYRKVFDFLVLQNTGISYFEYDWKGNAKWQLMTWNDHAHLADLVG